MTKTTKRERAINKFGNPVAKNAWKNNKTKAFVNKVKYNCKNCNNQRHSLIRCMCAEREYKGTISIMHGIEQEENYGYKILNISPIPEKYYKEN